MANVKQPCDEAVIRSNPCTTPCSRNTGRWVLAATILGSSMAMIDGTVINVALPVLQSQLNASTTEVQWIVESYTLFLAALILVGGSLADRFGRRRIFAGGVALFALASIWCGLSPTVNQLIIARAVQGIGGALLVPGSLAIISASFSSEQRGQAIGTWSGFTAITSALGPVIGGWLVENVSWRWIFFLNIPLAGIVLGILGCCFGNSRTRRACLRTYRIVSFRIVASSGSGLFGYWHTHLRGFCFCGSEQPCSNDAIVSI
jgi:MFS family permease